MSTETPTPEVAPEGLGVYVALHKVLRDMPDMERRKVQTFSAFNVDDVYATVKPLFVEHGLVLIPTKVLTADYVPGNYKSGGAYTHARLVMAYDLVAVGDGSKHRIEFAAEGIDNQDKATNKAVQQALKYALIQALFINTGEDAEEDPHPQGEEPDAGLQSDPNQWAYGHVAKRHGDKANEMWWQLREQVGATDDKAPLTQEQALAVVAKVKEQPK